MSQRFDVAAYLQRIGYDGPTTPDLDTLRVVHRANRMTVPFENLDIHRGVPIVLDVDLLYDKIVGQRRGGFCYEVNGAFAELLRQMGYQVTLLASMHHLHSGMFGPEFDHLVLRVDLDEPWLADVSTFDEPLRLVTGEQSHGEARFRIDEGERLMLSEQQDDGSWTPHYTFTLTPRDLHDFDAMCHYHQTSPDSHFTRGTLCSRSTPTGRITLSGDRLIVTDHGQRTEHHLADDDAIRDALWEHFGVE
jgi:N-hydroxyarylamine O-acetyltransferase